VDVVEDGGSGTLVPPGDAAALAQALAALVRDTGAREAMGARARAVAVARFDERDVLEGYRALFREVSSSRV
jgi:glycosyltransferase involved in cell wall biosynthesis